MKERNGLIKSSKSEKIYYAVMGIIAFIHLVLLVTPFIWLITQAFNSYYNYLMNPFSLPDTLNFDNFVAAIKHLNMTKYTDRGLVYFSFWNMTSYSLLVATLPSLIHVTLQMMVGYILAQYKHVWISRVWFSVNIVYMILPVMGALPATLRLYKALGVYDNLGLLFVNYVGLGMHLLYFYSTFVGMPAAYKEAAMLDGAGPLTIMFRIYLPLGMGMWFVVFILNFISRWQDYSINVTLLPSYPTLSYGVFMFQTTSTLLGASAPEQLAGLLLLSLPIAVLWGCSQKLITSKMYVGGLKG